jgi:hypothetical protein
MDKNDALVQFARGIAYCPCCTGVEECEPDCTIKEDSEALGGNALIRYEQMIAARAALKGK